MVIAQSLVEGLTLVSADAEIAKYSQSGLHLVI
jgi:PIN domain nuclease of toxin-antitoxin system